MKILYYQIFLLILLLSFPFLVLPKPVRAVELLKDTKFANGFSACWWLGKDYSPGPEVLKKGLCHSYQPSAVHTIKVIPDNDPSKTVAENNSNKYWEFNNGIHKNFTNENGELVSDLFIHNININHVLTNNTLNNLSLEQRTSSGDLIKKVSTNKNGKIYMYFNSKNEIRNIANKYSAEFANDTWPHFQLGQYFREYIDLSRYNGIDVTLTPRIIQWQIIPGWPYHNLPGYASPGSNLNLYVFIREKNNLLKGIFVGMTLYSNDPSKYQPYHGIDQHGQGFFRDDVRLYGGPARLNEPTTISFDLVSLVDKALTITNKTHSDYVLTFFELGFEGMGWFEGSFDLENLSMDGKMSTSFGDLNGDGRVDIFDFNLLVRNFGNPYTIFDYNLLVENFGK